MATGHPTQATSLYDADDLERMRREAEAALDHLERVRNLLQHCACQSEVRHALAAADSLYSAVWALGECTAHAGGDAVENA